MRAETHSARRDHATRQHETHGASQDRAAARPGSAKWHATIDEEPQRRHDGDVKETEHDEPDESSHERP